MALLFSFGTPADCIKRLLDLAVALKKELEIKYNQAITKDSQHLAKVFDLEVALNNLLAF